LIKAFLDARPGYEQLCTEVEYILKKKVLAASIETSFLGSRAKTLNSFMEKLKRKNYTDPFKQVDDFAGVRVVCLYNSEIGRIAEIIRAEFEVIQEVNKLEALDTNKFGYIGHHFIVHLGQNSSGARYDDLRSLRCEIQVRTVVQDAWSIIQHHMVYKKESQVPTNLIRKLNGLAGLFETVDDQFEFIRMQRDTYLGSIRDSKGERDDFLENELNYDSFNEYLLWRYDDENGDVRESGVTTVLDVLTDLNFSTLRDVETLVTDNQDFVDSAIEHSGVLDAGGAIHVALAVSAKPEWRARFPWGSPWTETFEQLEKKSKTR
jgi:ppGpp synthetase/RelA/SpoT-type nucleotidyltranferase